MTASVYLISYHHTNRTGDNMKHWILERSRAQNIITCLDLGNMTLKAAKLYYSAYGVEIKGNTKERFIKNLMLEVNKD